MKNSKVTCACTLDGFGGAMSSEGCKVHGFVKFSGRYQNNKKCSTCDRMLEYAELPKGTCNICRAFGALDAMADDHVPMSKTMVGGDSADLGRMQYEKQIV